MPTFPAVLRGGPFHGDSATLRVKAPPEIVYVFRCKNPKCHRKIHWTDESDQADFDMEIYRRLHEEAGIEIYLWEDVASEVDSWLTDFVMEPTPA